MRAIKTCKLVRERERESEREREREKEVVKQHSSFQVSSPLLST